MSAEETEPRGRGNQLLKVRMFADDNVLAMPNQYAVRITTASKFSRPMDLIRHCLQRHAMVELQLRQMNGKIDDVEAKRILLVSNTAFAARLKALGVTAAQATSDSMRRKDLLAGVSSKIWRSRVMMTALGIRHPFTFTLTLADLALDSKLQTA